MQTQSLPPLPWMAEPILPDTPMEPRALLHAYAQLRGAKTEGEIEAFLSPSPALTNPLVAMSGLSRAIHRVSQAIEKGETITVFGDYDCDGVTSSVLVRDVLLAAGHPTGSLWCYIPDRMIEGYGLSLKAASACIERQHPTLIIAVDCGSNSFETIAWLKGQGIDVIVIDHHSVLPSPEGKHPAYAHLNPKAEFGLNPALTQDATTLSAAGLCYFFAESIASVLEVPTWERDRALILGGLGSLVDVMPLVGTNRALVKYALALANNPDVLRSIPGLAALGMASKLKAFSTYAFGFVVGPCLNASGRLEHARTAVQLLSTRRIEKAKPLAEQLVATNNERKQIQERILDEATAQAAQFMEAWPETKVLFLAQEDWHPGIVGIVAGRIREQFRRPAIVAARMEDGFWKGSARSIPGFDLGALVTKAVAAGILAGGGGHAAAAGVKFTAEQHPKIHEWLLRETRDIEIETVTTYPILGDADGLPVDESAEVLEALSPFGMGNPTPYFTLENAVLCWGPKELTRRSDSSVWALKAGFRTRIGTLFVTWANEEQARAVWREGANYRMVLRFSRSNNAQGVFDEWTVLACSQS